MSAESFLAAAFGSLLAGALVCAWRALLAFRIYGRLRGLGLLGGDTVRGAASGWRRRPRRSLRWRIPLQAAAVVLVGAAVGFTLAGPPGLLVGCISGILPSALERRRERRVKETLEQQLAEVAEATALAVRSGLSVPQAIEFVTVDLGQPMAERLERFGDEQRLGTPFEVALQRFADGLGTEDAALFALVVSIHARSGGNLAGALEEVAATIRHRIGVRRELRALSAQGRISGTILGSLPIGFFVVVAATSHRELAPVYGSAAGLAMVTVGLVMEVLAFLWIRSLLRVAV